MHVDLHVHTVYSSDGIQTPEALAAALARAGVRVAALTDHDTVAGLDRFEAALGRHGIPALPGIELTTYLDGRIAHLLAYGFDPTHPELAATLVSLHQAHGPEAHGIAESLHRARSWRPADSATVAALSAAPGGRLEIGDAIELLHRAGGRVFLAHPVVLEPDLARLDDLVGRLKAMGLDGLEVVYDQSPEAEQAALRQLAHQHDLLISAGSDSHGPSGPDRKAPGIEMPHHDWLRFRAAVLSGPALAGRGTDGAGPGVPQASRSHPTARPLGFRARPFVLRIVLPTLAVMGLFLVALWGLVLPSFEQTLLDRKREMIRELTSAAWSVLAAYEADVQAGSLTAAEARSAAADLIGDLRYGPEGRDYFWVQDTESRMVMHPYRSDLEGQDLSGFTDPRGVAIFLEFSNLVEREDEGYVEYVWQWQDDPERLEPKESYVRGFAPWDWIIGTGLYTDDVRAEIARIERDLILAGLAISGTMALLLLVILQQSLRIERCRQEVVDSLHEASLRYHSLVEATTEGSLLILDGRCRYANPTCLEMLGYTSRQLALLDVADILPREPDNAALWEALDAGMLQSPALGEAREGCLSRSDGSVLECILALNPIELDGQPGYILLARDLTRVADVPGGGVVTLQAPAGVFRALAERRGVFVDLSPVGRQLLAGLGLGDGGQPALGDLFSDPSEWQRIRARLLTDGELRDHVLGVETPGGARFVSLSAALVRDEAQRPSYIDGLLVDVTEAREQAAGQEALIEKLQASLLFLHEPVSSLRQEAIVVDLDTPVGELARRMTEQGATAALVARGTDTIVGIITDQDLRSRAIAAGKTLDEPVHALMSAPLVRIPDVALAYEALMRMEEHDIRHLAVEDGDGSIVGVVDQATIMQFPRYGPLVLQREIGRAGTPEEVARQTGRALSLAGSLMDSGARPRHVTGMLTSTCDAATIRLIELAVEELGPPPTTFAFIAMGSQGRGEVTLLTDQDNGIVYRDAGGSDRDEVAGYFLRLGALVCAGLERAGYPRCRGKVMASEPGWCRSLADWTAAHDERLRAATPQDIADLSVLLDLRLVHGDGEVVQELLRHIHVTLSAEPAVLYQFARNALDFKTPIRLPGRIYLGGPEHGGRLDLKDTLMPIVAYARVEAARHRIGQAGTLERIDALVDLGIFSPSDRDEVAAGYDFLMRLRLQAQLEDIRAGRQAGTSIDLGTLGQTQKELLHKAFDHIAALQRRIERDFPEGG